MEVKDNGVITEGQELYIQDAVLVKSLSPCKKDVDFHQNLGTLSVIDYGETRGMFIEWRQCELTVESEDQEWAVVQDNKLSRSRTKSGCGSVLRAPEIQLKTSDLKSFQVSKNDRQITFTMNDGVTSSCFYFQHGSAKSLVCYLQSIMSTSVGWRNPGLHLVMDQPDVLSLNKSFAELELFPETKTDAIWSFMRKLHNRPVETTLGAFAKVSDVLLYKSADEEYVNEWLSQSLKAEELPRPNQEYELVNSKGTPLPPRTLPARVPPLSIEQWFVFHNAEGAIPESEVVKEIISHGGIQPCIRKDVWKFLLNYYPWNSTYVEREGIKKSKADDYYRMKLQWKTITKDQEDRFSDFKERKSLIEKDVTRTDRALEFYADDNNPNLELLQDILMTYVMYNFDLGYVQGMSDLLSPLLYLIQDEVDTFWCFTTMIDRMVQNFDVDQAGMKKQLQQLHQLVSTVEPELASYLLKQESSNMFFCFRWLLVWFKREFSYDDIYILWETLWAQSCPNYHLLICLAILDTEKDTLMSNGYGFTEILKHINELSNKIDLTLILRKAEGLLLQLTAASNLPNATRAILEMPLIPEEKENDLESEGPHVDEDYVNSTNLAESAFERSLSVQFF